MKLFYFSKYEKKKKLFADLKAENGAMKDEIAELKVVPLEILLLHYLLFLTGKVG